MRHPWPWLSSAVVLLLAVGILYGLSLSAPPPSAARAAWAAIAYAIAVLAGCAGIALAWPSLPRPLERWGWACIATAILLLVVSDGGSALRQPFHLWSLPAMWADGTRLAGYLLIQLGLLLQPSLHQRHRYARLVMLLEIGIGITAAMTLLWYFTLGPVLLGAVHLTMEARALALIFPVMNLALFICAVLLLFRSHLAAFRPPRAILSISALLFVFGEAWYAYHQVENSVTATVQGAWTGPLGFLLIGLAAWLQAQAYQGGVRGYPAMLGLPSRWRVLIPYGLVSAVVVAGLLLLVERLPLLQERGLLIGMVFAFALVILRQWLTFAENRRLYQELRDAYHEMAHLAQTDPITKLPNYRYFMERLDEEISRADRYHTPLALIFADLDFFKRINDTYGHRAGDEVLRQIGEAMQGVIRQPDVLARYAGEEFVILLPQTTLEQAATLAERIRQTIEQVAVVLPNDVTLSLTISLGLSAYPRPSASLEALIADADAAMYRVKRDGRNGVALVPLDACLRLPFPPAEPVAAADRTV